METAYVPVNGFVYREDVLPALLLFLCFPPRSLTSRRSISRRVLASGSLAVISIICFSRIRGYLERGRKKPPPPCSLVCRLICPRGRIDRSVWTIEIWIPEQHALPIPSAA